MRNTALLLALFATACGSKDTGEVIDLDGDGWSMPEGDCSDLDPTIHPDATEVCDGVDNDCDGQTDEDVEGATLWYEDADGDGFGNAASSVASCTLPTGYVPSSTDCDDTSATTSPISSERCDGVDNDCDNAVDEDDAIGKPTWYRDVDGDGWGVDTDSVSTCNAPSGYVIDDGDCDDANADWHPEAEEDCTRPDDMNCDGTLVWVDADVDGFAQCIDCDDINPAINPAATEVCDYVDNNCDGVSDEPEATDALTWFEDADADGYGNPDSTTPACTQPLGWVSDSADCDDTDSAINPETLWHPDEDGDGYGARYEYEVGCEPVGDWVFDGTDCDDTDPLMTPVETCRTDDDGDGFYWEVDDCEDADATRYPGAPEVCGDGVLNDCDGIEWDASLECFTGDLDVAYALATWTGELEGDNAGYSVTGVGDATGDGIPDLMVGAFYNDEGATDAGAAYLLRGDITGEHVLTEARAKIRGSAEEDLVGYTMEYCGDVNEDGYDDLFMGSWGDDTAGSGAGAAYVLLGGVSGTYTLSDAYLGIVGEETWNKAGTTISAAQDWDGDGVHDFATGAMNESAIERYNGAGYVVLGGFDGVLSLSDAYAKYTGESRDDFAGHSVALTGDTDGDGLSDLIIGTPGDDAGGASAGAVYLVLGGGAGTTSLADADAKIKGNTGSEAGKTVSYVGDSNGDGYSDLLVGAWLGAGGKGTAFVMNGPVSGVMTSDKAELSITGGPGDCAGWALDGGGDVNADGKADVLVGAYNAEEVGAAYVIVGGTEGSVDLAAEYPVRAMGGRKGATAGWSVAFVGDLDMDGLDDWAFGATQDSSATGSVYVMPTGGWY